MMLRIHNSAHCYGGITLALTVVEDPQQRAMLLMKNSNARCYFSKIKDYYGE
jgi:hypothetical protein